jgi:hypothetical protein
MRTDKEKQRQNKRFMHFFLYPLIFFGDNQGVKQAASSTEGVEQYL